MAAFNKFNSFTSDQLLSKIDWDTDGFKLMLTNVAPVATNTIKGDLTEISSGNGYTAGGASLSITATSASGTATIKASNVVWTAAGGSIGPFRYVVIYDDSIASPVKPLVCWWDYGSSITLASGETFTVSFDSTNGIFSLS